MRAFVSAGVGVVALVITLLGTAFSSTGAVLAIALVPTTTGLVFLSLGVAFLAVGASVPVRYDRADASTSALDRPS